MMTEKTVALKITHKVWLAFVLGASILSFSSSAMSVPVEVMVDAVNPTSRGIQTKALVSSLALIRFALDGGDLGSSLHKDIVLLNGSVEGLRRSNAKLVETKMKSDKYYRSRKILAVNDVLKSPALKDNNCQAMVTTQVLVPGGGASKASGSIAASMSHGIKGRSTQTRDVYKDTSEIVKAHDYIFCSKEKLDAGMCKKECKVGDPNCSIDADQSTSKFLGMDNGHTYQNKAEEQGAMTQIALAVDPSPSLAPSKANMLSGKSDPYKKASIIDANDADVATDILTNIAGERTDIGATPDVVALIKKIDPKDRNTITAYMKQGKNSNPANKKLVAGASFLKSPFLKGIESNIGFPKRNHHVSGSAPVSERKIMDILLAEQFGNPLWEAKLTGTSPVKIQELGKAVAFGNYLTLKLYDRITQLLVVQTRQYALMMRKKGKMRDMAKQSFESHR